MATRRFQQRFGINMYCRYVDNLLFVVKADGHGTGLDLVNLLRSDALLPYRGKCEEVNFKSVDLLDAHVFKGADFGETRRFSYRPFIKDNGKILNHESCHPVSVHIAWPAAYLRRLWARSSSIALYAVAKEGFVQRLRASGFDPMFTLRIEQCTQYIQPHQSIHFNARPEASQKLWLPLCYHPYAKRFYSKCIREHLLDGFNAELLNCVFGKRENLVVDVAWRMIGRPFNLTHVQW